MCQAESVESKHVVAYTQWRQHQGFFAHLSANRSRVVVALEGKVDRRIARSTLRRFLSHATTCLGASDVRKGPADFYTERLARVA